MDREKRSQDSQLKHWRGIFSEQIAEKINLFNLSRYGEGYS